MTAPGMVVVRSTDAGGAGSADALLDEATRRLEHRVVVDGPDDAVDRLRTHQGEVALVVIGPGVPRPLAVGRALRRTDGSVGLVYVAPPDDADRLRLELGMLAELRQAQVIDADGPAHELGEELRVAWEAAVRRNRSDRVIDALNRELVDRSRQDLRRAADRTVSESYLAAIVRHVPEAIVSVDHGHRVVAVNDAAVDLFELGQGEALDTTLHEALGREPALHQLVDQALQGVAAAGEQLQLGAGDDGLLLAVTAAPVRDHAGEVLGAVLVARDITVQRRAEDRLQQLQKAQSLATLAGGVAHDFNNLLVTVRSWAQLAAEEPEDGDLVATALDRIVAAADRAAELARSMLVYSGRGNFELEPVDLNRLVEQMTELMRGSVHRKIGLRLDLDTELPSVDAAASQLRQVVMNLVTNAAEAIGDTEGTITVRTRPLETPPPSDEIGRRSAERYVCVEVSDTGPGMDRETMQRVFEPFFTTKFEGRGLGLAASHGIVAAHDGSLTVSSRPGHGATFRMTLPVPDRGSAP